MRASTKLWLLLILLWQAYSYNYLKARLLLHKRPIRSALFDVGNSLLLEPSEQSRILLSISTAVVDVVPTVRFIRKWGKEQASFGPAIQHMDIPDGVCFSFTPSPGSVIAITAKIREASSSVMDISSELILKGGNANVRQLVAFAAANIVDSFLLEIQSLIAAGINPTASIDTSPSMPNEQTTIPPVSKNDKLHTEEKLPRIPLEAPMTLTNTPEEVRLTDDITIGYNNGGEVRFAPQEYDSLELDEDEVDMDLLESMAKPYQPPKVDSIDISQLWQSEQPMTQEDIKPRVEVVKRKQPRLKVLKSWSLVTEYDCRILVQFLQLWSRKFVGRGVGIIPTNQDDGVELEFAANANLRLRLHAHMYNHSSPLSWSPESSVVKAYPIVSYQFVYKDTNGHDYIPTADEQQTATAISATLLKGLRNELNSLLVKNYDHLASPAVPIDRSTIEANAEDGEILRPAPAFNPQQPLNMHVIQEDSVMDTTAAIRAFEVAQSQVQLTSTPSTPVNRKRDPQLLYRAGEVGVKVEKFEGMGIEDQAVKDLNELLKSSRRAGFLSVLQTAGNKSVEAVEGLLVSRNVTEVLHSGLSVAQMLRRQVQEESPEDLLKPTTKFPMFLENSSLAKGKGGIDIFEGPPSYELEGNAVLNKDSVAGQIARELAMHTPPDPISLPVDQQRLDMLMRELNQTSEEIHDTVLDGFRDLLLSDNILYLLRQANESVSDYSSRLQFRKIAEKSMFLTAELGAMVKTESVRHLQTIQDVCEVAAVYQSDELKFLDKMDLIKPRFDTALLGYLNFAIKEETNRLQQIGNVNQLPSEWIQVLSIVRQGVLAEFAVRYERLLEPLLLVVRFEDPDVRSDLFSQFVNVTAAVDLAYMRQLALNMVDNVMSNNATMEALVAAGKESIITTMKGFKMDIDNHLNEDVIADRMFQFEEAAKLQGVSVVTRLRNSDAQYEVDAAAKSERDRLVSTRSILDSGKIKAE